jgi:hypothetical protein
LIRWVNFSPDNIITIPKDKIMTIAGATKEMAGQYNIISKEYHSLRPPKQDKNYEAKELADIDQKKIRELFEEFDDEDGDKTIH